MSRKAIVIFVLVGALAVAAIAWPRTQGDSATGSRENTGGDSATNATGVDAGLNGAEPAAAGLPVPSGGAGAQATFVTPRATITLPVTATAPTPELTLVPLGVYQTGIFDGGAAEIAGYDAASRRAFVTNATLSGVDILDISDPSAPRHVGAIDTSPYGESPTSLDVHDGLVAIAVKSARKTENGRIVLADADGRILANVEAGVRPDMITFTPDGARVLTADEGEPTQSYDADPEASVTIVDLRGGVEGLTQDAVTHVDFRTYNNIDLDPSIRIFGPGATVAQDLEPEYVAVSPDSKRAWVTLQENNALAVVDIEKGLAVELIPLGFKDHGRPFVTGLRNFAFGDLPAVGTTPAGQEVPLGGFSGLIFEGIEEDTGALLFVTHTDRGPNASREDVDGDGVEERPFVIPDYSPVLVRFALDPASGAIAVREQIVLKGKDGEPLSGLPNVTRMPGIPRADESPVDLMGQPLTPDPYGADLEAVAYAPDGTWWMADEYRPSLFHFDADGRLIERYVPAGTNQGGLALGVEALPAALAQRQDNRGFEALALDEGILYAFMQSPIDNPASEGDISAERSRLVRIVAFDTARAQTVGEYLYVQEGGTVDKLGDALSLGQGEFLVLERDDIAGSSARKFIFRISLAGATNLLEGDASRLEGPDQGLEILSLDDLAAAGIQPVQKRLFVDLTAAGYELVDKPEGMALVDDETIAVVNDDDFGLSGTFDVETGAVDPNPNPLPSLLTLISLKSTALDASDRDGGIHLANWPVLGMFQPDAIDAYEAGGARYLVTANEGDARVYEGFSEETRVDDLALDERAFPSASELQRKENLGRLRTTSAPGSAGNDADGDGLADRILAFGTRSIAIWDENGNLVWDSGDELERMTAALLTESFNSGDQNDSFDSRSDVSGPEPEGLALGEIDGRTYAFVGLERIGGIAVYDVSDPFNPRFMTYATTRDFTGDAAAGTAGDLSPEGVTFVPAAASPTGNPLLLVAHELSGSTRIFAVETTR